MEIRQIREGDIESIKGLCAVAWLKAANPKKRKAEILTLTYKDIKEKFIDSGGDFLLVFFEGKLVAMGGLEKIDEKTGKLSWLRVHSDYKNHGLAGMLTDRREEKARAWGATKLITEVEITNTQELSVIRKKGFREIGKRDGENGLVFLEFEKKLN